MLSNFASRQNRIQDEDRCESIAPIAKFDEGPRRCRGEKEHRGNHWGYTSDAQHVEPRFDYIDKWNDQGHFVP